MIDEAGVVRRVVRLQALARELAGEIADWREGDDPLLYLERLTLLAALHAALGGVEDARVVMAKARRRLRQA
jgi:hypothetical protein